MVNILVDPLVLKRKAMANIAKRNQMSPWIDFFDPDNFFDRNWLKRWDRDLKGKTSTQR
jgi:hypothetical protein